MSLSTKNPLRLLGGVVHSGIPHCGEVPWTRGGSHTYSALSGVNVATVICSGGGRLNSILVVHNLQSGQQVNFVDAVPVATSGMPLVNSGHKVIGVIPPVHQVGQSGTILPASQPGQPQQVDITFWSGLLACPLNSGTASFSVCYSVETSGAFPQG